ncbi:MAG: DinB family protein [Dehalococcoidia bacterium]
MHPTYEAATHVLRATLGDLTQLLDDLPAEAADWRPFAEANSLAVLVRHGLTATRFLSATAAGLEPDRAAYMANDRAEAFAASGTTPEVLRGEIAAALPEIEAALARGSDAALTAQASWALGGSTRFPSGAELLIHAMGHLKEHTGQAGLLRDLWKAGVGR